MVAGPPKGKKGGGTPVASQPPLYLPPSSLHKQPIRDSRNTSQSKAEIEKEWDPKTDALSLMFKFESLWFLYIYCMSILSSRCLSNILCPTYVIFLIHVKQPFWWNSKPLALSDAKQSTKDMYVVCSFFSLASKYCKWLETFSLLQCLSRTGYYLLSSTALERFQAK